MAKIDDFLPNYDFVEKHSRQIKATPEQAYDALLQLDLTKSLFIRIFFFMRGLQTASFQTIRKTFYTLVEDPPHEIVLGLIGRPWKITGDLLQLQPKEYLAFNEPSYVKMAWDFRFQLVENGTLVSTETRIFGLSKSSKIKFGCYWFFVRPFSGLVRIEMLRLMAKTLERDYETKTH